MHAPKIDLSTPAGAAIVQLFADLKDIEDSDGGWNGGDTVQVLCDWFNLYGIDVDASAELLANVAQRAAE